MRKPESSPRFLPYGRQVIDETCRSLPLFTSMTIEDVRLVADVLLDLVHG